MVIYLKMAYLGEGNCKHIEEFKILGRKTHHIQLHLDARTTSMLSRTNKPRRLILHATSKYNNNSCLPKRGDVTRALKLYRLQ